MLQVMVDGDRALRFGDDFDVTFQRTLRIPDDGRTYPLPPGLGCFPISRVEDYSERVPGNWLEHGGIFIPMYQREALWISFGGWGWRPNAVKVAVGMINAVSGKPWDQELKPDEEDYLVCPPQPWLDGINAGDGFIRQFVAMPLGMGYTVEAQVTGEERFGGIQIVVYGPKAWRFLENPPERELGGAPSDAVFDACLPCTPCAGGTEMGIAAGGKMKQDIYPDPHGVDTWDRENFGRAYVHIVNSLMYREITGKEPPPTPVTARTYAQYGLPWFDLYQEGLGDISPSEALAKVKSIKEIDKKKGFAPQQDDDSIDIPKEKVIKISKGPVTVKDGDW